MLPNPFPFEDARVLFRKPEVVDTTTPECKNIKWNDPDVDGLKAYLVDEKNFNAERVNKAIERLQKCKGKGTQNRLEDFFGKGVIHSSSKKREPEKIKAKGKGLGVKKAKK